MVLFLYWGIGKMRENVLLRVGYQITHTSTLLNGHFRLKFVRKYVEFLLYPTWGIIHRRQLSASAVRPSVSLSVPALSRQWKDVESSKLAGNEAHDTDDP